MCSPFAVFISIRRVNCHVICFLNYSCHFIWEETYINLYYFISCPFSIHVYKCMNIIIIVCLNAE